ncbi:MAG: ComF family protein [Clostridia bacterium]|nr:ComF family protein [Clostridia bacterium]
MKKEEQIKNILDKITDILYPPTCGICGKLSNEFLCKRCELMLDKHAKFAVEKNQDIDKNFIEHLYIFQYEGIIRKIILKYKFKDKPYLYKTFVNFLLKNEKIFEILQSYDTIIPVPISKKRQKERGYNQSYLIAREIAKRTSLRLENSCLFKVKNIIEQSKLNKEDRLKNIQGVYELQNEEILHNRKIILIDDIYTTGSTVYECCKILKKAKPEKIGVLTIAKD